MAIDLPQIDYTSRDYNSFKADMISLVASKVPEWTNLHESDLGIILIELFAHVADNLAYYQDKQANEAFLGTAQLRRNVINLCKLIDYDLAGPVAATGSVRFTVSVSGSDQTIPEGTIVSTPGSTTDDPVLFETNADLIITAGNTTGDANVTEGRSYTENLGTSNASANQAFSLSKVPIITPTVSVTDAILVEVDEGLGYQTWDWVDNIIESGGSDKVWYFDTDENDVTSIVFGDGYNGKIPTNGATVRATYRNGGGLRGNVGAGQINVLTSGPVFISAVTNLVSTTGGDDKESLDHARVFAPASLKRNNRVVTLDDYRSIAGGYPGVVAAGATTFTTPLNLCTVDIFVAPTGGGTPSGALLTEIQAYIDLFRPVCTNIVMHAAEYVYIDVSATINVLDGYLQVATQSNVNIALADYFAEGQFLFGLNVYLSNLYAVLEEVEGVDYLTITKMTMQPYLRAIQATGNATFGAITVGAGITAELWTIDFTSPTTFTVTGAISGLQVNTGTLGVTYSSDSGDLNFQITAGGIPMIAGDQFTIRTSTIVGNVEIDDTQMVLGGAYSLSMVGGS